MGEENRKQLMKKIKSGSHTIVPKIKNQGVELKIINAASKDLL